MRTTTLAKMNMMVLTGFLIFAAAQAADQTGAAGSKDEHHSDAQTAKKSEGTEMMGKEGMMGMMHECMEMHKDGKMCEHQTMEQCQKNMEKGECQKMMKDVKKVEKKSKSKK